MTEYFAKNGLFVSWISGSTQEEQSDADNVNFLEQCLRMLYLLPPCNTEARVEQFTSALKHLKLGEKRGN